MLCMACASASIRCAPSAARRRRSSSEWGALLQGVLPPLRVLAPEVPPPLRTLAPTTCWTLAPGVPHPLREEPPAPRALKPLREAPPEMKSSAGPVEGRTPNTAR